MRISDWSSDVCSSDLFAFIDIGKVRGPSDVFAIHGVKNYAAMATATRWVMGYDSGTLSGGSSGLSITATPAELYAAFQTHPRLEERSEEHTSELQSLMRTSYAVFCLKKKTKDKTH